MGLLLIEGTKKGRGMFKLLYNHCRVGAGGWLLGVIDDTKVFPLFFSLYG